MKNSPTSETQARQTWDVFVTFDDDRAKQQATEVCDFITRVYWPEIEFELQWCDFGHLGDAEALEKAVRAAAEARIIIVSTSAKEPLPGATRAWMDRLCANRHRREGALIGLVGDDEESESRAAIEHQLRQAAHQAGLDYLTHAPDCRSLPMPDETDWVNAKAANLGSVLGSILSTPMKPPLLGTP